MANFPVPTFDPATGRLPDIVMDALTESITPARQRYDPAGEALAAKLDMGVGDIVVNLMGDSTGDEATEWFRLWVNQIAADHPKLRVEYTRWNIADAYDAKTIVQAGEGYIPAGPRTVVSDNFNRTASSLIGTSPQTGGAWTGTSTAWALNGSAALAGQPVGDAVSSGGVTGEGTALATGVGLDTTPGGSTARQIRVYVKYVSPATNLYAYVNIATTGAVSSGFVKRINGTATNLGLGGALNLTANTVNTFNMSATTNGTAASMTINGVTTSYTLAQSDVDTFASSTTAGIGTSGGPADVGTTVDSFAFTITAAEVPAGQRLIAYNGSVGGSVLSHQQARLEGMMPVRPDLVFISSSHNYFDMQPSTYVTTVTQFVDALRARYSDVPVTLSSQNPRYSPATYIREHLARLVQLRILALQKGWGYLPVTESFQIQSDGGRSLVHADGIHPIAGGSALWAQVATAYLRSKSLIPS